MSSSGVFIARPNCICRDLILSGDSLDRSFQLSLGCEMLVTSIISRFDFHRTKRDNFIAKENADVLAGNGFS
jgi:hypothetical protein